MKKRLYRSQNDKIITGLCGGLAEYFDTSSFLIRCIVMIVSFGSIGIGFLVYFILSFIIPQKPSNRIEAEFTDADC